MHDAGMEPLLDRLERAESELCHLRQNARTLSETVAQLKKEARQRINPVVGPRAERAARPVMTQDTQPKLHPRPRQAVMTPPPLPPVIETNQEVTAPEPTERNLELHLGRVWSVRLGIVLLTTGLVFLSRYTYDAVIRDLGPGIRLTIMYLISFFLTGAGLVCERWKSSLQSYGRIVAAGGLAAIYYCGFAAYNVEALKVIEDPLWASVLLFTSAALFCGVSLWRHSRVMLSTSLALAFYSIAINPVGWMACLSALVLSAFGIAMMSRFRWVEVGFLVMVGSYLSYLWWQYAVSTGASEASHWYLATYWMLFAAASLSPGRPSHPGRHLLFTGINNSVFFVLFAFRFQSMDWMEKHWLFCFVFGALLVLLSWLGRNRFPEKSKIVHLVKGISIVTLGLALLLNGTQLFVALLLEALVLMIVSKKFPNRFTNAASWGVAMLSILPLTGLPINQVAPFSWIFGAGAWLALASIHRSGDEKMNIASALASAVSFGLLGFGLMLSWQPWDRGLALGTSGAIAAALLLMPQFRKHGLEAGGVFLAGGFLTALSLIGLPAPSVDATLGMACLALISSTPLAIFARTASRTEMREGAHLCSAGFLALALFFFGSAIHVSVLPPLAKLIIILAIPVAGSLLALRTKLLVHSLVPFLFHLAIFQTGIFSTEGFFIGTLFSGVHFFVIHRFSKLPDREPLRGALFIITSAFWVSFLISGLDHPGLPLALTAVGLLLGSSFFGKWLTQSVAIPIFLMGVVASIALANPLGTYLSLASFLALHLARTSTASKEPLNILTVTTLTILWWQLSRDAGDAPFAAVWAVTGTAALLIGLGLKSRCFRLMGLVFLAGSLGHLMLVDVVKLSPLPRILSFMTLGVGLLGLGFVYNRWQDRLKQIL